MSKNIENKKLKFNSEQGDLNGKLHYTVWYGTFKSDLK